MCPPRRIPYTARYKAGNGEPGWSQPRDENPRDEEIAIIEASSKSSWAITDQGKMDTVVGRLKEEAAKLGANGLLLQMTGSESTGGVVTGISSGTNPTVGTGIYSAAMHKTGRALAIHVDQ